MLKVRTRKSYEQLEVSRRARSMKLKWKMANPSRISVRSRERERDANIHVTLPFSPKYKRESDGKKQMSGCQHCTLNNNRNVCFARHSCAQLGSRDFLRSLGYNAASTSNQRRNVESAPVRRRYTSITQYKVRIIITVGSGTRFECRVCLDLKAN